MPAYNLVILLILCIKLLFNYEITTFIPIYDYSASNCLYRTNHNANYLKEVRIEQTILNNAANASFDQEYHETKPIKTKQRKRGPGFKRFQFNKKPKAVTHYNNIVKSNYSYAVDYFQQEPKQLVLFTSVEMKMDNSPDYDVVNHIRMYSFFQTHFNFTAIVFSKSSSIKELCQQYNIMTVDHYETNPFGIPLIRDLYQQASHLIRSRFYGFINSDIILSPNIFDFLTVVERRIQNKEIPENLEIAGRVHVTLYDGETLISSMMRYETYLRLCKRSTQYLRNVNSADYFIFPNTFNFAVMKDAVIGRSRIDNYLMGLVVKSNGFLINTTDNIVSYHLGGRGYQRKNFKKQKKSDREWNWRYANMPIIGFNRARWKPKSI